MVAANTDALTNALATVMTEFNSRIEVQYGENFQKFNESLGHLLQWQQSYTGQLDEMLRAQEASVEVISHASQSYEQMIVHSQNFNRVAESLGNLLGGLEQQTSNLEVICRGCPASSGRHPRDCLRSVTTSAS